MVKNWYLLISTCYIWLERKFNADSTFLKNLCLKMRRFPVTSSQSQRWRHQFLKGKNYTLQMATCYICLERKFDADQTFLRNQGVKMHCFCAFDCQRETDDIINYEFAMLSFAYGELGYLKRIRYFKILSLWVPGPTMSFPGSRSRGPGSQGYVPLGLYMTCKRPF